ncbi:bZIP transcription factor [Halorhabdus sp. CBA1104]|uniref:DUF7518 family protein n=1 Tax=unclassified Halorhabdus TaxID=2621901 RepID=UPI0012B40B8F|nr:MULTISPECIES: bZIP transcription factor [unclassified Halorhabdus]QGN06206.1 bZIP transcription factor [Halorhabdus sp. CBA1104]
MSDNRVEELEAKVKDLEATVEGLTDELVESKVRLRELENVVDDNTGFKEPAEIEHESVPESDAAEADKGQGDDIPDDAETESDIIIA